MDGELFIGVVGLMVAPLYWMVHEGFMKIEKRLTTLEITIEKHS